MYKVDFHTHSTASPDGGIKSEEYVVMLENGILDYIAITDHNTISLARELHDSLGEHIIVGEEITSNQGEIIGLFLTEPIKAGMNALTTARAITAQGGLVYIPHPLETVRKGVTRETLDVLAKEIDIVEIHNGRAVVQNRGPQAATWSKLAGKAMAASSDAHGVRGLGRTYTLLPDVPTAKGLVASLGQAHYVLNRPSLRSLLYPKYHRARKKMGRNS
jgi:predicted metal-dependent phosphoesterase TrpH